MPEPEPEDDLQPDEGTEQTESAEEENGQMKLF